MNRKWLPWFLLLLLNTPLLHAGAALWGNLKPGPYSVGFTVRLEYDYSRTFLPKHTFDGKRTEGERARPVQIAVWYPAAKSSRAPMLLEEYVWLIAQELNFGPLTEPGKQESVNRFIRERMTFAGATQAGASALLKLSTQGVRNADAVRDSFPLILFAPGSSGTTFSDSILCEYLASHGYIVAAMPSLGAYSRAATVDQVGFYSYMQDIEFTLSRMHEFPNVDNDRLGVVGFSMGGSAATLVQLRNTDIDAAVYLDTGSIFTIVDGWFRPIPFYNLKDLRAPQLYLTRQDAQFLDLSLIDAMPYTDRHLVVFGKGFRHPDFISDGMFPALVTGYNEEKRTQDPKILYEAVARYTLEFLNGYVKKDPAGLNYLKRSPEQNGVPPNLMTAEFKPALPPPPREPEFINLYRDNPEKARAVFKEVMHKNGGVPFFREASLNALGYEYVFRRELDRAIDVFRLNTEAYPQSANAFDSLSEALEIAGRKDLAIESARKALALIEQDPSLDDARKTALRKASQDRMQRLS